MGDLTEMTAVVASTAWGPTTSSNLVPKGKKSAIERRSSYKVQHKGT